MSLKNAGHATSNELIWLHKIEERLHKNPYDVNALIELGFLYIEPLHDPKQALATLEYAIGLAPDNVDAHFWLAKTLYHDHFRNAEMLKESFGREKALLMVQAAAGAEPGCPRCPILLKQISDL